ncbi:MAG: carboxypeptidase-like regulatory domain-containing protein [Bacteroidetes bacterium]|nr:carboxypeptidase-like regulatory domain-containing protein [Bacteroidota bacterium]
MKFIPAIIFLFLPWLTVQSQSVIKGRVVVASNGTPIAGCSIFITNTSKGTTSDANGMFELTSIPPGKHDLVVSSIGYETIVYSFSEAQLPLQLKFEMQIKAKELANVTLEESVEEGWEKWGVTFTENFIGTVPNAAFCKILNEKAIRFRYYRKSNRVIAYCDEPILIENKSLGYRIKYQLENFEVNFKAGTLAYLGYSLYEPMEARSNSRKKTWEERREKAYYGSVLHFMRSIYAGKLQEEGFDVRRMKRIPNAEKERVRKTYKGQRMVFNRDGSKISQMQIGSDDSKLPEDSATYFNKIMHQPDYFEVYDTALLKADSLVMEEAGEIKTIHFENYLFVTYTQAKEDDAFLKTVYPPRKASLQRSYVFLSGTMAIYIDMNGNYFDPQEFITTGYWGWREKMANSLPQDYEPGN